MCMCVHASVQAGLGWGRPAGPLIAASWLGLSSLVSGPLLSLSLPLSLVTIARGPKVPRAATPALGGTKASRWVGELQGPKDCR